MQRPIKFRAWAGKGFVDFKRSFENGSVGFKQVNDDTPDILEIQGVNTGNSSLVWQQFTGLTDRHGKEIYEGDILADDIGVMGEQLGEPMLAEVRWDAQRRGWTTLKEGEEALWFAGKAPFFDWEQCEVIGNVWENPELLAPTQVNPAATSSPEASTEHQENAKDAPGGQGGH